MNAVIYYSNTKECFNIASYISNKVSYPLKDITQLSEYTFDLIYFIFPVHYQSIPKEIIPQIKKIKANKAIVLATYGKMSFGHVLYDIQKILKTKIIAGAYVPAKHAYIKEDNCFSSYDRIDEIINLENRIDEIKFPKTKRNPLSSLFPRFRHQIGVKIIRNKKCTSCSKCNLVCPNINNGNINNKCIRCLKCVYACKNNALDFKLNPFLKRYLTKTRMNQFIVY